MARPKNTKAHRQMTSAARMLFLEKGYHATSYADIAQACGLAKTNVQQHFPTKDIFISDFVRELLDCIDTFLAERNERTDNYYVNLYHLGQIFFAFLLSSEALQRFTFDMISERKLTDMLIDLEVEWATSYEVGFSREERNAFSDDIAMTMGGIYELLYRNLKVGKVMEPQVIQWKIMSAFAYAQGLSQEEVKTLFPDNLVSETEFREAIDYLKNQLFPE